MPLRRHPALVSLSRDHHHALLLARALRKDTPRNLRTDVPSESRERIAHVVRVFRDELEPHFQSEERMLLPAMRGREPSLEAEILDEHARLRAMVEALSRPSEIANVDQALDEFGALLESHVRKEERALYPRLQELLTDEELTLVGAAIEAHMQATCPTRKGTA